MWRAIARTSLGVLILTGGGAASATPAVSQPNSLRVVDEQGASAPTVGGEAPAAAADDDPPAELNEANADHDNSTDKESHDAVSVSPLAALVRQVLDEYHQQPLNTRDDPPWSVLHWSIAYGVDATVSVGDPQGKRVTAIGWLCCNYPAAGKQLIGVKGDRFELPIAPGRQGHDGQFLSMLAQSRVNRSYLLRIGDQEKTVADLIEYEKATCRSEMELTFKLTGLAHYEGTEAVWKNARGEPWSVRRLLEEELQQPIGRYEATCGGLHRLFAINYAVDRRRREGLTIDGPWRAAELKTVKYQQRAFKLQNRDGSFSTAWLDEAEQRGDVTRRLTTTGHVLEWLAFSLPDEQLQDPRFERAVRFVAGLLKGRADDEWHPGALGHSLHALAIYEQHVLDSQPGDRSERLAQNAAAAR